MDISKSIRESFDLYRQNFGTVFLATLVASIGCVVSFGILAGPLVGGMLMLCRKLMRGEQAGVGEVFAYFSKFVPTFVIVMAMWLTMLIAAGLHSIPLVGFVVQMAVGPAVGVLFIIAIGLIIEQNYEPIAALKQACNYFMTNPLLIWFYSFIISFISGIGAFLFVIPIIFTLPMGTTGMAVLYRELVGKEIEVIAKLEEPK